MYEVDAKSEDWADTYIRQAWPDSSSHFLMYRNIPMHIRLVPTIPVVHTLAVSRNI